MSNTTTTSSTPSICFNGYSIEASYSFSEYKGTPKATKNKKVWLDMVFTHPVKDEAVTIRAAKSSRILDQPKEVIEAIALRDLRDFLSLAL